MKRKTKLEIETGQQALGLNEKLTSRKSIDGRAQQTLEQLKERWGVKGANAWETPPATIEVEGMVRETWNITGGHTGGETIYELVRIVDEHGCMTDK